MGLFMQRYLILLLVISVSALNLSGCGNKGPLYLPAEPIQVEISSSEEIENNKQPESSDDTKQNDE
jgi:predicted small lipoprotein YifL